MCIVSGMPWVATEQVSQEGGFNFHAGVTELSDMNFK